MAELWPWFTMIFGAIFSTGLAFMWFESRLQFIREILQIHSQQIWSMTDQIVYLQELLSKATSHEQDKTPTE